MAMNRGHKPGGGIASRQHVEKPIRTGAPARGYGPGWTSQLGQAQGDHTTVQGGRGTGYRGDPMLTRSPAGGAVPLGNETAAKCGQGPGGGRTIYKMGTQDQ